MRERSIERHLVKETEKRGGIAPKLVSPGTDGMPDRLVILPGCGVAFVELKAPGEKPRPIQRKRIRDLVGLGCSVYVVDSKERVVEVLDEIQST